MAEGVQVKVGRGVFVRVGESVLVGVVVGSLVDVRAIVTVETVNGFKA